MHPNNLKPLLVNPPIGQDLVRAKAIAEDWYAHGASLSAFVVNSILAELLRRGWDDDQGVPTADANRFAADVLPSMHRLLDATIASPTVTPLAELEALAAACHPIGIATPTIVQRTVP